MVSCRVVSSLVVSCRVMSTSCRVGKAVGVELDLSAIASAAVNANNNGLKMDTYYPQEVRSD